MFAVSLIKSNLSAAGPVGLRVGAYFAGVASNLVYGSYFNKALSRDTGLGAAAY